MTTWNPQNPVTVSLRRLLRSASFVGCGDVQVTDATDRSDQCGPGVLFAALPGTRTHGQNHIAEAVARGARAVLVERPLVDVNIPQCVVPDARRAYGLVCAALAGAPATRLKIVGVTGTNGKSTVTWLIRSILETAGFPTGLLGTIEYHDGRRRQPATLTTPDPRTLFRWLSRMASNGTTHAAIEVSSHALDQHRIAGLHLDAAVITNITHDHFDYHGTFESYRSAKRRILESCRPGATVVINRDDPGAWSLREAVPSELRAVSYGIEQPADVSARVLELSLAGSRFLLQIAEDSIEVETPLLGPHNVSNCLAAAAVARGWGLSLETIAEGIRKQDGVPGRLERIDSGQPFTVLVDYAHTPDALEKCLASVRRLTAGRLICVFGAGGDRDRTKRPELGRAAMRSDVIVVTSDNPRTEPPDRIIADVLDGIDSTRCVCHVEPDRRAAIVWAIENARPNDCVLIAGKGHETTQIVGTEPLPFDDREVVREVLSRAAPPPPHVITRAVRV